MGRELGLTEWLELIHRKDDPWVLPNNCFASIEHKKEYLESVQERDKFEFRRLVRKFLNKSANYGADDGRLAWLIERYSPEDVMSDRLRTEFDRRSIPTHGPQWEGITWVLDLLPRYPREAVASIKAYSRAHIQQFTDFMINGHYDAMDLIRARHNLTQKKSCFISYGCPDERFAEKLYNSLAQRNVQVFFFPVHAVPGEKLHKVMRSGVNEYDKIILICSKASLNRPGVLNELTETLQREARDGGKTYLIPIRLDDYVFTDWTPADPQLAMTIRDRVVANFADASRDEASYTTSLERLMAALEEKGSS